MKVLLTIPLSWKWHYWSLWPDGFLNMKNQSKFGLLKVVCNEKQGGVEACLPFKFAVVFKFNVFPFPPSKLEGNDLMNRKIHRIGTCNFLFHITGSDYWCTESSWVTQNILGRYTHYPSFILLYISLSLYLDSFSFLHLPISTSTSPFPSQSPSPSLSSSLSLSPSIKQKTEIIQNGGQQCAAFCLKEKRTLITSVWGLHRTNATFPPPPHLVLITDYL